MTFRTRGRLRGSMSAEGQSLGAQIQAAVRSAARDKRFYSRLTNIDLRAAGPGDMVANQFRAGFAGRSCDRQFSRIGCGWSGVRLDTKSAYYKPSVAITSGRYTTGALLSALCKKAGLARDAWKDPKCIVLRTRWIVISCDSRSESSSQPGGAAEVVISDIVRWLRESAAYLTNSIQPTCTEYNQGYRFHYGMLGWNFTFRLTPSNVDMPHLRKTDARARLINLTSDSWLFAKDAPIQPVDEH